MRDGGFMSKALEVLSAVAMIVAASVVVWALALKPQPQGAPPPAEDVDVTIPLLESARLFGTSSRAVVEFTDFECPFCKQYATTVLPNVRTMDVSYFSLNFPMSQHQQAEGAALAALCAARQHRLEGMHGKLFTSALDPASYSAYASGLGIDPVAFVQCLAQPYTKGALDTHQKIAKTVGVRGTPSIYVGTIQGDGIHLTRRIGWNVLEEELKKLVAN
jgi:protein-disulfide isomerase